MPLKDEYSFEAQQLAERLTPGFDLAQTKATVAEVFRDAFGDDLLDEATVAARLDSAATKIHALLGR